MTYSNNEMVSSTEFAKRFGNNLDKVTSNKIEKLAILKNNSIEAVVISKNRYENMMEIIYPQPKEKRIVNPDLILKGIQEIIKWANRSKLQFPEQESNLLKVEAILFADNLDDDFEYKISVFSKNLIKGELQVSLLYLTNFPKEIEILQALKYISVSNGGFSILPKEIGNLPKLETLRFSDMGLRKLPKEIGNLSELILLEITNNRTFHIPKEIGNLRNLKFISFYGNDLNELPKEISKLNKLEILNLGANPLTAIPKEISQCEYLRVLDLSNTKIIELPDELAELYYLKELYLPEDTILSDKLESALKLNRCKIYRSKYQDVSKRERYSRRSIEKYLSFAIPSVHI